MRIVINQKGKFLHTKITDNYLRNRLEKVLSFRELPVSLIYPISKYAPIGKYDIFLITLEVSHEGIKTPFMIGPKTFTAPFAVPLIDDFPEYFYAILDTLKERDRWEAYKDFTPPNENVLEKGFTFDYLEGVLPQTVFKYERKFFEHLDTIYDNSLIFSSALSTNTELTEDYFETLSEHVITLETDKFIDKPHSQIDAEIVYEYPRFTVPITSSPWIVYVTLGYEDYGQKIRQMFRISPLVYAPVDFEIMLMNFDKIKKEIKKSKTIIERAPDFYNPIKDQAKELITEFIDYYTKLSTVAKGAHELEIFDPNNKIEQDLSEYLQVTPEGYEIVIQCQNECTEKEVERAKKFEQLIRSKVLHADMLLL